MVHDRVWDDGELIEDTNDWVAQAKNPDLWYCGDESKDYELFDGDEPPLPEPVSIDGSFKAGRDGDKPGILFPGSPAVGQVYRQKFSLGNAEDVAEVLTTTFACDGKEPEFDDLVPDSPSSLNGSSSFKEFCAAACVGGDCVVNKEWSPLEPEVVEWKYYAPNIGMFLEVNLDTGETSELVDYCVDGETCSPPPPPI